MVIIGLKIKLFTVVSLRIKMAIFSMDFNGDSTNPFPTSISFELSHTPSTFGCSPYELPEPPKGHPIILYVPDPVMLERLFVKSKEVFAVVVPFTVYVPSPFAVQVTPFCVVVCKVGFSRFFPVTFTTGSTTLLISCG